nr:MAG TPA: hypothetical protein [Caudoviricetes sp.]
MAACSKAPSLAIIIPWAICTTLHAAHLYLNSINCIYLISITQHVDKPVESVETFHSLFAYSRIKLIEMWCK